MSYPDDLKESVNVWDDGGHRPTQPSPSPPRQTEAVQAHELPPAYDNTTTPIPRTARPRRERLNPLQQLSSLSKLNFGGYVIPEGTPSDDRSTLTTSAQIYLRVTEPGTLANVIREQSTLPPWPSVRILGTHTDGGGSRKVDFDLSLNLLSMLDLDSPPDSHLRILSVPVDQQQGASRGSAIFKRGSGSTASLSPLQHWTKAFVTDKSENKSFDLKRVLLGFPTQTIEGQIRTLLAQLKYRGRLEVSFPCQHSRIVVHKQTSNWLVSLLKIYPEKKFEVVESVWNVKGATDGVGEAKWTAEEWWDDWEGVVRNGVLRGMRGRVSVEEWMGWKTGLREEDKNGEWGVEWAST